VLEKQPVIVGGSIGGVFTAAGLSFRWIEFLNDVRAGLFNMAFGDQIQFFRRRQLKASLGFPNIPLMEDVELCLRLNKLGRQVYLFGDVVISARDWLSAGRGRAFLILRLFFTYVIKRFFGRADSLEMYQRYYQSKDK